MKHLLIYALVIVLLSATGPLRGYNINGTVPGLKDSTWIFLSQGSKESRIDSCRLMGGRFHMQGRIPDTALRVIMQVGPTFLNYKGFWLQNTDIMITCTDSLLKKATVSGSPMEDEQKQLEAFVSQEPQRRQERKQEWIKQHPHSLMAAWEIRFNAIAWGKETTVALYNNLSLEIKACSFGQYIKEYILLHQNIVVGDRFVDFEQPNTTGQLVKLSQLKGKYTLLEFWSSMCGPCIEGHPKLVKTYEQFKSKGFAIVGVSLDFNKKGWLKAVAKDKLPWENLCDLRGNENNAAVIYGVTYMPSNYLIDEKGIIIAKDLHDDALVQKLQQLLP